jgi:hypothetical protein
MRSAKRGFQLEERSDLKEERRLGSLEAGREVEKESSEEGVVRRDFVEETIRDQARSPEAGNVDGFKANIVSGEEGKIQ